ncbi:nitrite reductase large subunit NirB [Paenibacillus mucilaginosus]|uniref:nitrite reductase large subunit NirB n=1 Tax=Paenibacillus mucilaginosus TaxID=61624 RepID=UPI0005A0F8FA|nr:nitrite reductase large subunit NirB [Paenibacillus mucilaginosus]MCG7217100.1 nitrite reductase large subunit NirB [Paenibacillus mucilaginosus]WDM28265.1 nitrite reductase large subunit NirB [Paenibacillus mucilaginosus]
MKRKLVLVGNGMAGVWCVEHMLKLAPQRFEVTIFGSEPHPNYNRILLSSVLAGDSSMKDIVLNDWDWYRDNGITLHAGHTVTKIDKVKRTVTSDKGVTVPYDELILATGSRAFILPVPGADKEGVIAFRDIKDCETMMESAKKYKKAVVIGGGLLGLEAARGLLNLNMEVSVVHIHDYVMERQLDQTASSMLRTELEAQGMKFLLQKHTEQILGRDRVTGVKFKDGSVVEADLVVMAVGIRPNVAIAKDHGIEVNRGIVVNDFLETNVPNIYAVGECAEHRGVAYGLVAPLYEQGDVLAKRLCGLEVSGYEGSVTSTKLKVSGVDVFSAGQYREAPGTRAIKVVDEFDGIYKKVLIRDGKVVGAVMFGDTSDSTRIFKLIRTGEDVSGREKEVVLGEGFGGAGGKSAGSGVAAMADDEIICGCNGVSKGAIVKAINEQGLTSVDAIKACTGASRSCGGCKPLVGEVLQCTLGADGVTAAKEGICGCTTLGRDEVVEAIRSMHLTTSKEVMNVLGWENTEGCSKCRPALNYYLGMVWPVEHEEERESRFVNERNHANIQKDGTYSVIPRIYGGVTSPQELKRIAEVAEKYEVPLVKFTGGQRLDLLGVKKEDLPKVWEDLDMPSGYGYGKALRTVKTCVGNTFCRFGTQDAMGMGIAIERRFERLNTPAKVKIAVSGCPRNCAEATIKDFGIVAIDGGWELHVGGNGGVKVRATDLLCKVKTEEEVMEYAAAYLQFYRETGKWNERTSEWLPRIGLETVRAALDTPEKRQALVARIDEALQVMTDPWKEIIETPSLRATFEELPGSLAVDASAAAEAAAGLESEAAAAVERP